MNRRDQIACPACDSGEYRVLFPDRFRSLQLVECTDCGEQWKSREAGVWDTAMDALRDAARSTKQKRPRVAWADVNGEYRIEGDPKLRCVPALEPQASDEELPV